MTKTATRPCVGLDPAMLLELTDEQRVERAQRLGLPAPQRLWMDVSGTLILEGEEVVNDRSTLGDACTRGSQA